MDKIINIEELKQIQLEMLVKIDDFCKKNGIKYFLTAGSLIGAVRHRGFIPWDDDIDIMMLRKDYDMFLKSFNGEFDNLRVNAPELNWNFYAPFANVFDIRTKIEKKGQTFCNEDMSVKIDIFPFDNLPQSDIVYYITQKVVLGLNHIMRVKRMAVPWKELPHRYLFTKIFMGWFPYSLAQRIIHFIALSNNKSKNSDVFLRTFDITKLMRARIDIFEDSVYVPFEQYFFPIPVLADEFLRIRFGDYMKLPPVEERKPHHNFDAYWK